MSEKNPTKNAAANTSSISGGTKQLIQSSKKIAAKYLQSGLQKVFSSIDDSLFEYADKSDGNQQQSTYFEAMRQIRKDKKIAAQLFFTTFEKIFNDCLKGENSYITSSKGPETDDGDFSFASLSLIEDDDLEESLAFTNMIEKAHGMYREDLLALGQRFNQIVPDVELSSENFPMSPEHICHAFEEAGEKLSVDLEIKLIIYKLFEKHVITELGGMYSEINNNFKTAGILPTIKFKAPVKSKESPRVETAESEGDNQNVQNIGTSPAEKIDVSVESASFDSLRELLAQHRGGGAPVQSSSGVGAGDSGSMGGASGGAGGGSGGDGDGGNIGSADVLSGLTQLQVGYATGATTSADPSSIDDLKVQLMETISALKGSLQAGGLENDDSDAIDIVSMMFEFILEDKSLSDRFRAEIARLQIPIIKVAIIDKTFFAEQDHAARILLNELAYAGSTHDSEDISVSDELFKKVEYVVDTVIAQFQSNMDIFDQLLTEFRSFVDTKLQVNKKTEQKLAETKKKVSDVISKRLKKANIPDEISNIILIHWKDVLNTIGMKNGIGSQQWRAAVDVIDDLIWSVQPKLMPSEKQDLTRSIPKIVKNLKNGLNFIGLDSNTVTRLLSDLQQIHLLCLKGANNWGAETDDADLESILNADIEKALNPDPDPKDGNPFESDFGDVEYFDSGNDDFSMIKLPPKVMRSQNLATVKEMELSTWVEFYDDDKIKRGKLSWRCDFTGDFTFVDRRYRVVADISMAELVTRIDNGTAAIIKDVPLLDRALDAVISTMGKYQKDDSGETSPIT